MTAIRVFRQSQRQFKQTNVEGAHTAICRAVDDSTSRTLGAGIETLSNVRFDWTLTYDEVLFIKEGSLRLWCAGERHDCEPGDIVWLPNGVTITYDAPGTCTYFYALYPVDWAKRQGRAEP